MGQIHVARNTDSEDIKLTNRPVIDKIVDDAEERILALEEDWDGQGSPPFEKQTLNAIRDFLFQLVDESELSVVKQVWIIPFSGGSIDLQWQTEHFDLLINFCADGNVTYASSTLLPLRMKESIISTEKIATALRSYSRISRQHKPGAALRNISGIIQRSKESMNLPR